MKPIERLATANAPDGGQLVLARRDGNYAISVDRHELMTSRQHESELELARLGCARLTDVRNPNVLIGGLGMGYTLRQALDMLQPKATIVVAELIPEIVTWNRNILGELAGYPLRDKRVVVKTCDVCHLIAKSRHAFDAILLDVDNGPWALTDRDNERLYTREGIRACRDALTHRGCLAVWASGMDRQFARRLNQARLYARFFRVPAYKGAKSLSRCIWVATRNERDLPPLPEPKPRKRK